MNSTPASLQGAAQRVKGYAARLARATLETVHRVETDSSFRREFLRAPVERRAWHPALATGHFAPLSYPCPKARRNASDAGGNACDLSASDGLPSASASKRRMVSRRDGRLRAVCYSAEMEADGRE